jgi:hypothetical protein
VIALLVRAENYYNNLRGPREMGVLSLPSSLASLECSRAAVATIILTLLFAHLAEPIKQAVLKMFWSQEDTKIRKISKEEMISFNHFREALMTKTHMISIHHSRHRTALQINKIIFTTKASNN